MRNDRWRRSNTFSTPQNQWFTTNETFFRQCYVMMVISSKIMKKNLFLRIHLFISIGFADFRLSDEIREISNNTFFLPNTCNCEPFQIFTKFKIILRSLLNHRYYICKCIELNASQWLFSMYLRIFMHNTSEYTESRSFRSFFFFFEYDYFLNFWWDQMIQSWKRSPISSTVGLLGFFMYTHSNTSFLYV